MHVQALITEPPVKRFNEGIFHWFARSYEVELHALTIGPIFQGAGLKFGAMVDGDGPRAPALAQDTIKHLTDRLSRHSQSHL